MLEKIRDSLVTILTDTFNCSVHTDNKEHDDKPYFTLLAADMKEKNFIFGRKQFIYPISIYYVTPETNDDVDLSQIVEKLYTCLKFIDLEDTCIRGTDFMAQYKNNVLEVRLNYSVFVYEVKTASPLMESFTVASRKVKEHEKIKG